MPQMVERPPLPAPPGSEGRKGSKGVSKIVVPDALLGLDVSRGPSTPAHDQAAPEESLDALKADLASIRNAKAEADVGPLNAVPQRATGQRNRRAPTARHRVVLPPDDDDDDDDNDGGEGRDGDEEDADDFALPNERRHKRSVSGLVKRASYRMEPLRPDQIPLRPKATSPSVPLPSPSTSPSSATSNPRPVIPATTRTKAASTSAPSHHGGKENDGNAKPHTHPGRTQTDSLAEQLAHEQRVRQQLSDEVQDMRRLLGVLTERAFKGMNPASIQRALVPPEDASPLEVQLKHMHTHVNLAGWMEKQGRFFKSWKRRWFVLVCTSLVYYDSPERTAGGKPKGEVDLEVDGTTVKELVHMEAMRDVVCIEQEGRKLYISSDPSQMKEWAQAIQCKLDVLKYLKDLRKSQGVPSHKVLELVNDPTINTWTVNDEALCGPAECTCLIRPLAFATHLTTVSLPGCGLRDERLSTLCDGFHHNQSIRVLDLSDNGITHTGARRLAGALSARVGGGRRPLQTLNVHQNPLGEAGACSVIELLMSEGTPRLENLSLSHTRMGPLACARLAEVMYTVASADDGREVMPQLLLDHNQIRDEGVVALRSVLEAAASIQLSHNEIGDDGAGVIADVVATSPHLRHLDTTGNGFGAKGLKNLAKAVMISQNLESAAIQAGHVLDASAIATLRLIHTTCAF